FSAHSEMVRIEWDIGQRESARAVRGHAVVVTADRVVNLNFRTGDDCAGWVSDHALDRSRTSGSLGCSLIAQKKNNCNERERRKQQERFHGNTHSSSNVGW